MRTKSMTSVSDNEAIIAFHKMRNFATGLFIFMTCVFLFAKYFEPRFHWISYVRAFSEAAMVGALADWFAVTALFRHPLGLPIPHTAIIPNSKDRIGTGLGNFISRNFLQPDQVKRRLDNVDIADSLAEYLSQGEKAQQIALVIAQTLPKLFGLLNDGPIMSWLQSSLKTKLQAADFSSFFADALELFTREKRHVKLIDLIIFHADIALTQYEPKFREKVSQNTGWLPKLFSVDDTASDALFTALKASLKDAAQDNNHSLRNSIDEALVHLQFNLRNDGDLRGQIKKWQDDLINHPQINEYISVVWRDIKNGLSDTNGEKQTNIANAIAGALQNAAISLQNNVELRKAIDERLKNWAVDLAAAQGDGVGKMVADTIKSWDATTVVTQIETAVGRDLQYIRINGTLIGGLVGLIIYIASSLIFTQ